MRNVLMGVGHSLFFYVLRCQKHVVCCVYVYLSYLYSLLHRSWLCGRPQEVLWLGSVRPALYHGGGTMSQHVSTLRTQETLLASYCQISSSIFGKRWKKELLGPQLADPSIIYCMTVWDELRDSRIFTVWIWTSVQATWAMRGTRNVDFDPDRCSQQMTKVTSRNSGSR